MYLRVDRNRIKNALEFALPIAAGGNRIASHHIRAEQVGASERGLRFSDLVLAHPQGDGFSIDFHTQADRLGADHLLAALEVELRFTVNNGFQRQRAVFGHGQRHAVFLIGSEVENRPADIRLDDQPGNDRRVHQVHRRRVKLGVLFLSVKLQPCNRFFCSCIIDYSPRFSEDKAVHSGPGRIIVHRTRPRFVSEVIV